MKEFMQAKNEKSEPVRPSDGEVRRNPKSRSAILRVLTKNENI